MHREKWKQLIGILLAFAFILLNYSPQVQNFSKIPVVLKIAEGQSHTLDFQFPLNVQVRGNNIDVLKLNGNSLKDHAIYNLREPIQIEPVTRGKVKLYFTWLGIIPIKSMEVMVFPRQTLTPGGHSIGVTLYTKGALVVGTSEVTDVNGQSSFPADDAGIIPGDVIVGINGRQIQDAEHLSEMVNEYTNTPLDIELMRKGQKMHVTIEPVKDFQDKKYRLGMWVRDSTAGVGTMTFYNPKNKAFGALGHAITDLDTGALLDVKNGEIMKSEIIDIKLGQKGDPGELKGIFLENQKVLGNIVRNTDFGIYGKCYKPIVNPLYQKPIPVGFQSMVHEGKASILTTLDEGEIREYDIEIIRVNRQNIASQKSLIVKVTDPELLRKTGGIVQGMSGSPILQNGRIVGAITHVFVNDPTKGFGIFIEWMLQQTDF